MSQERVLLLRKGFVGSCALAALLLLVSFYSIVNGAVDRAARQRFTTANASLATLQTAMPRQQARSQALLASVGN